MAGHTRALVAHVHGRTCLSDLCDAAGLFIGMVMPIVGGANVKFANGVGSLLYATSIPLAVIGISLTYRQLKGDTVIEPHVATRERDPDKAARTTLLEETANRPAELGSTA
jgi:hypothetical protein